MFGANSLAALLLCGSAFYEGGMFLNDAFDADIKMVSSEIIANQCMALIHSPLLAPFLEVVRRETDAWADQVIARLDAGGR